MLVNSQTSAAKKSEENHLNSMFTNSTHGHGINITHVLMIVFATREEIKQIVWRTKDTPTLTEASRTIHLIAIIAANANLCWYCTSTQSLQAAACIPDASLIHCWGLDVKIAHVGEILSWCKVSTHVVVGDGVCASHSGVAAKGICGNRRGGHLRGCSDGGSGGLMVMVEIVFGGFCLLRTCNYPNLIFLNYTQGDLK